MSHLNVRDLSASLDGVLAGPALEQVESHLASCITCRSRRERLARHEDALRRLLATDPDDHLLDELARRSEALVVAIVRDQQLPPIVTSTPLEDGTPPLEPGTVERFGRFESGRGEAAADPTTFETHHSKPSAKPTDELPPARDPSRAMQRPDADESTRWTPEHETPRAAEPGWESKPKRDDKAGRSFAADYDAFNDLGYAGPTAPRTPPSLPQPGTARQQPPEPAAEPPRREYRHGGVRREPVEERATPPPEQRPEPSQRGARAHGFGVKRAGEPAWERLGLEPDPQAPGMFREPLTGAVFEPPSPHARPARRPVAPPAPGRRGNRALIAALVAVAGLAVVGFFLRDSIPGLGTASRSDARVPAVETARREAESPTPPTEQLDVRDATTRPPVESVVPPASTAPHTESKICGMVLDASAHPVAGALLIVAGNVDPVRSGSDGRFCLSAPAGTHFVDIIDPRSPGGRAKRVPVDFAPGAPEFRVQLP